MSRSAPPPPIGALPGPPGGGGDASLHTRATSVIERAGMAPDAAAVRLRTAREPAPGTRLPSADSPGEAPPAPTSRRNPLVALIHDENDPSLVAMVAAGMTAALAQGQLALVLQPLHRNTAMARLRQFLRRYRPAGVVLLPPLCMRDDLAALCAAVSVPCVQLGATGGGDAMACDERQAARQIVGWLIEQGHRRIGLVAGPESSASAQQRELGYIDAMADNGLDRGPSLIIPGNHSFESGIEAGRLLLEISPRPTAILAGNDEMAVGVLHAAAQMGVWVPSELSVAGFDDTPLAARSLPPLTTVHVPWERMGREAVRQIAAGETQTGTGAAFTARLVIRDSVAPPPT